VAEKKSGSRVPEVVGAIPVVGGVLRSADQQAQWMQEMVEQQARLVSQMPTILKALNDAIEAFNQTVQRLDRTVTRIETTTNTIVTPLEKVAATLDPSRLAELPDMLDTLRREAIPALRATTDTQRQVALLQATVDRILAMISELPGMGLVKRMSGRAQPPAATQPPAQP
jgi:ABC-type transporter Mla subunit MlaD